MLVSYNWLKEYVDLSDITPDELAEKITKAGIEVEQIDKLGAGISGVVVGLVESCEPHPDADKLNLCQVNLGAETVQIVCGAPNVAKGQKVPVAQVGAILPGDFKIKKAKLRGQTSQGMICSLGELGVADHLVPKEVADGIYVLPDEVEIGANALSYMNLDDAVLELDILPNSAHCLNLIGVAYEVAAILNREIHLPKPAYKAESDLASDLVQVRIKAKNEAPYYGAKVVKNLSIKPSPKWLQNRLISAGIRPINNVVDVTNFVMLEYGQPLHAFDYDEFGSNEVVVRMAREDESMKTLDNQIRELLPTDLLITNGKDPVAIAGVMGGADSEVTETTTNVLLEAAMFDGTSVRRTSTRLGLRTDASQRFEKGLDRNRVVPAAERACQLLKEVAGATILDGIAESGERQIEPYMIQMPWQKISDVLGVELEINTIKSVLNRLGFRTSVEGETLTVEVPVRRPDVTIPEDLIEEVGRIYGYDNIPSTLPEGVSTQGRLTNYQAWRRRVRRYMEGAGYNQAITYSLTTAAKAKLLNLADTMHRESVALPLPMSEDHSVLRMSIVPQLIDVVQYHANRQLPDVRLFELGSVFLGQREKEDLPQEKERLAGVMSGSWQGGDWYSKGEPVDFFTLKGTLEGLFELLDVADQVTLKPAKMNGMHPGRTAEINLNETTIGYLGQIHPSVQKDMGIEDTYVFELDLEQLLTYDAGTLTYQTLPRFPAITRDIALVVDEDMPAGELREVIEANGGELLKAVNLFDVYQGQNMEEGKKSLAFSLKYIDPERTLTDKEVAAVHDKILEQLQEKTGASLRS